MEKKEEYDSQQKEDSEKKGDIKKASWRTLALNKTYQFVSFSAYQLLQLNVYFQCDSIEDLEWSIRLF